MSAPGDIAVVGGGVGSLVDAGPDPRRGVGTVETGSRHVILGEERVAAQGSFGIGGSFAPVVHHQVHAGTHSVSHVPVGGGLARALETLEVGDGLRQIVVDQLVDLGIGGTGVRTGTLGRHVPRHDGYRRFVLVTLVGELKTLRQREVGKRTRHQRLAAVIDKRLVFGIRRDRGQDVVGLLVQLVAEIPGEHGHGIVGVAIRILERNRKPLVVAVVRHHVGTVAVGGDTYGRIAEVVVERRGATSGPVGQELREDRRQGVDIRLQTFGVVLHDLLFLILGHNTALGERIEVGAGDHNRRPQGKYPYFIDCFHIHVVI